MAKLHIGIDADSGEIVAFDLTDKDVDDASHVHTIGSTDEAPASFMADGAYDGPRISMPSSPETPSASSSFLLARGPYWTNCDNIADPARLGISFGVEEHGRMNWQKASGYNKRSKVEAAISRYKCVIGDALKFTPRRPTRDRSRIAVKSLNRMNGVRAGQIHPVGLDKYRVNVPTRHSRPPCNKVAARGICVTYETVRQWGKKFGKAFSDRIRQRVGSRGQMASG